MAYDLSMPAPPMTAAENALAVFAEAVDRLFDRDAPETFWRCEEPLRRLIDGGFAAQMLARELDTLTGDPAYIGDWQPSQLMIHRGRGFALSLALLESSRRYVHTLPFYGLYAPAGDEPLRYDAFRLPQHYRNEVFDPALSLEPADSGVVQPGEVLALRAREYAYDFHVERPVLVAKLTTAPFHTLEWLFSKDSLRAWQANDAELSATQLRVAAYLLGRLAHQSSLPALRQLAQHPHHAVRWAAIQALGRLSRTEVMAQLEHARHDPHPHVSRAAAKTLRQLEGKH